MSIKASKHDLAMTVLAERWNVEDLKKQNAELLAALEELVKSLEWEEQRSGTTYNGFETAKAAIAKAKGE